MVQLDTDAVSWPLWRRILFRYCCILIVLITLPWGWLPGVSQEWIVTFFNQHLLHVRPVLVPAAGSGDTSFGWAELFTNLILAAIACLIWSLIHYRRKSYRHLAYWLCLLTRYYVALISFSYGLSKIFLQQMPRPGISQLATPLGDFSGMRLTWMYLGYSSPYQFFSGCMEVLVGLLLVWRRTATLGTLLAVAVYSNVMMLNFCYDIPVKIFSAEILFLNLFLLANEWGRVSCFLFNKPADACVLYQPPVRGTNWQMSRIFLKAGFALLVILQVSSAANRYREARVPKADTGIKTGLYEVRMFCRNNDTLGLDASANRLWRDLVFDKASRGSAGTTDTTFNQRYGRGYFYYIANRADSTIELRRSEEANRLAWFKYTYPTDSTVLLSGSQGSETLLILLELSTHQFQLEQPQFHWIHETVP